jgi:hypothetical protein
MTIGSGAGIDGSGMAYDDANDILYVINFNGLYTVSTVTGTSTFIGPTGLSASDVRNEVGLAYDESNNILYANVSLPDPGDLYTLDVTSGLATLVGSNGVDGIDGLAWLDNCEIAEINVVISPIPTLNQWGLIAMASILGIVGFMVLRRRKVTA